MKKVLIFSAFLFLSIQLIAQNSIEIITLIQKPYSPYLSDYIDGKNTSLLIKNLDTISHRIMLFVTIEGDNGIRISSRKGTKPFSALELAPGETKQLMGFNLVKYIAWKDLEVIGVNREQVIRTNALPEGSYQICFQALDFETEEPLSPSAPQGCDLFEVVFPDVPQLVLPNDNDSITTRNGLIPITFVWMPPVPTPANIRYKLQMAEYFDPSMDPNQVLDATTKFYFEKDLSASNYTTQPTDPPLRDGKNYCWRVVAYDPTGAVLIKNNGKSIAYKFFVTRSHPQVPFDTTTTPWDTSTTGGKRQEGTESPEKKQQGGGATGSGLTGIIKLEIPNCSAPTEYKDVQIYSSSPLNFDKNYEVQHYRELLEIYGADAPIIEIRNDRDFYLVWLLEPLSLFLNKEITFKISILNQTNQLVAVFSAVENSNMHLNHLFYKIDRETIRNFLRHNAKYYCIIEAYDNQGNILGKSEPCLFRFIETFPKSLDNRFTTYKIRGTLRYTFQGYENEKFPINLSSFKLYKRLLVKDEFGNIIRKNLDPKDFVQFTNQTPDFVSVSLDEKCNFLAEIVSTKENGFLTDLLNYQITYPVPETISGKLYEYYVIDLEDPYFINPETEILLTSENLNLGEIVAYVLSYQLNIYVTKKYKGGKYVDYNPDGIKVNVYRISSNEVPYYEGEIKATDSKIPPNELKFVSKGRVINEKDEKGRIRTLVVVDKLICNQYPNDYYLIDIIQEKIEDGEKRIYSSDFMMKPFSFKPEPEELLSSISNKQYNFKQTTNATIISLEPPSASISGRLVETNPADPNSSPKPLSNKKIGLMLTYLVKDSDGNFTLIDPYHILKDLQNSKNKSISGNLSADFYDSLDNSLQNQFKDGNMIVATTITDGQGNFLFDNFVHYDSLKGFSGSLQMNFATGSNSGFIQLNGEIIKAFRVVLCGSEQEYYYNPSKNIIIQPFDSIDVGTLEAIPRTYSLTVIPRKSPLEKNQFEPGGVLYGSKVEISRYDLIPPKLGIVQNNNGVTFYGLKLHNPELDYDDYKIEISTSDTIGENAYQTRTIFFPRGFMDWNQDPVYRKFKSILERPIDYSNSEVQSAKTFCESFESLHKRKIKNLFIGLTGVLLFTDEFEAISDTISVYLEPKPSQISGRILNALNPERSVEKGTVYLLLCQDENPLDLQIYDYRFVSEENQNGYFVFYNLPSEPNIKFRLKISCPGYHLFKIKNDKGGEETNLKGHFIPPLQSPEFRLARGQNLHLSQILMMPNGKIKGYVENEQGEPVESFVRTTVSNLVKTYSSNDEDSKSVRQTFEVPYAFDSYDTLFVFPLDSRFFSDTIPIINVPKQNPELDIGRIIVKERSHKIRIHVYDEKTRERLSNFKVELGGQVYSSGISNQPLTITFKNPDVENFQIKIYPDPNSNYIPLFAELTNKESKDFVDYNFYLSQGYELYGQITYKGNPVQDAIVFVTIGNTRKEARSGPNGAYELKGIPSFQPIPQNPPFAEIFCVPPDQMGYVSCYGVGIKVTFTQNRQRLDFELPSIDNLNLTKLYGFKIKITKLDSVATSRYLISGFLDLNDIQSPFKLLSENQTVTFSNILVQPSKTLEDEKGRKFLEHIPEPSTPSEIVSLDLSSLSLTFEGNTGNRKYNIFASPRNNNDEVSFLSILKETPNSGVIKSTARILLNSFKLPQSFILFDNTQFYLNEKEGNSFANTITLFSSKKSKTQKDIDKLEKSGKEYYLSDRNGKNLKFKLFDFNAEADVGNSILKPNGEIQLQALLSTQIVLNPQNNSFLKININIPALSILPDSINSRGEINPFTINLENWKLSVKNSLLSSRYGGFYTKYAEITSKNFKIPIGELYLRNGSLYLNQITINSLPLPLGKVLKFKNQNFRFAIDPNCGSDQRLHFKISSFGEPAAELPGLPGFNVKPLIFQTVSILSNDEKIFSFSNDYPKVPFNNIIMLRPQTLSLFEEAISLSGLVSFGIPRIPNEIPFQIRFYKSNSKDTFNFSVPDFSFTAPGNIEFESNINTGGMLIQPDELRIPGKIFEKDYIEPFDVWMVKENQPRQTSILLKSRNTKYYFPSENFPPDKRFILDSVLFSANSVDWSFLTLKLIPTEELKEAGFGNSQLYFTAYGDLKIDEQMPSQITFKDFSLPYNDFSLWYDISRLSFFGNINLPRTNLGNVAFEGSGEFVLDKNGFFVAGNGKLSINNLEPVVSGILIGNYQGKVPLGIPEYSLNRVLSNSIGNGLPCNFDNTSSINGVFVTGRYDFYTSQLDTTIVLDSIPIRILGSPEVEISIWKNFKPSKEMGLSAIVNLDLVAGLLYNQNCLELNAKSNTIFKVQTEWLKEQNLMLTTTEEIPLFGKYERKEILSDECGKTLYSLGSENGKLLSLPVSLSFDNLTGLKIFFGGNYFSNSCSKVFNK